MNKSDIRRLQGHSGYPHVTVLLPADADAPERGKPAALDRALSEVEQRLAGELSARQCRAILDRLRGMADAAAGHHGGHGLALFASAEHGEWHQLPFAVEPRVVIDETYATRELVYAFNRAPRYRVLAIDDDASRLYEGLGDELTELTTGGFPCLHDRSDGDAGPDQGREAIAKSIAEAIRALARIHEADPLPLVIAAAEDHADVFRQRFPDTARLAGEIPGDHADTAAPELGARARPLLNGWLAARRDADLKHLEAAAGDGRVAAGLQDCWQMATTGRVERLLVESDYRVAGRVDDSGTLVPVDDPQAPGVIDDAVDELIETVLARGGRVTFFEPGRLEARRRIAAIVQDQSPAADGTLP